MKSDTKEAPPDKLSAANYCIGFIDLLGQRDAVQGQQLLPALTCEAEIIEFKKIVQTSIGGIFRLQMSAETMFTSLRKATEESPFRKSLHSDEHPQWDEIRRTKVMRQRWSDGLVFFSNLGDQEIKCRMNGIFEILCMCGLHCFLGLAMHQPIRGAIDVAWGVELHSGELYGPVVARVYELESEQAKYPRIVIGQTVVDMLITHRDALPTDVYARLNSVIAEQCLKMIAQDEDGLYVLHYLGEGFSQTVTSEIHQELYAKAHEFAVEQLEKFKALENAKLVYRYQQLLRYFDSHPPMSPVT